ncbi:hypothetical protein QAD02_016339 [Eretmocerus hayati]|uniref:Uncharacterized protein n=1 Tax=Eretmocerus hayati TaxID=131215 RepID=A0ACC2PAT3_9HYME|nr:hypothetical protein QAD02_016339 [Eretmocerus hayati]
MKSDLLDKYHNFGLRIVHVCPDSERLPGYYFIIGLGFFHLTLGIPAIVLDHDDFDTRMFRVIPVVGLIILLGKFLALFIMSREVAALIEEVHDDWNSEDISKPAHEIIEKNIKTARYLSHSMMALYGFVNVSLLLRSIALYLTGDVEKREFMTPIIFFWNIKESPAYEILMVSQFIMSSAGVYNAGIIEGQLAFLVREITVVEIAMSLVSALQSYKGAKLIFGIEKSIEQ